MNLLLIFSGNVMDLTNSIIRPAAGKEFSDNSGATSIA